MTKLKIPAIHATHYPRRGKGFKWSISELDDITEEWQGDFIADGEGLTGEIIVTSTGISISFKYSYKQKVDDRRVSKLFYCGSYPNSKITDIRDNRDKAKELIANGIDPKVHKVAERIEAQQKIDDAIKTHAVEQSKNLDVEALYLDWITKGVNRADENANLKLTFCKHVIPVIGHIKVKDLTEDHLHKLIENIIANGKLRTASELINSLRQMFNWADGGKDWRKLLSEGNPAARLSAKQLMPKTFKKARERVLTPYEIYILYRMFVQPNIYCTSEENYKELTYSLKKEYQLAVLICLGTLCRIGEVVKAEWAHIDPKRREWIFPADNTKGQIDSHSVYISNFTLGWLKTLRKLTGHSKWLFPSERTDTHIGEKVITKAIGDRQKKFRDLTGEFKNRKTDNALVLGNEKWTPHDMRRTGATMMQQLKIDRDIINLCQHHVIGSQTDKHYLLAKQNEEKKEAWQVLGDRLELIIFAYDVEDLEQFEDAKYVDREDYDENEHDWNSGMEE